MIRARFFVAGEPATQGSKRIVQPKGHRRPMLIEQTSKKLGPWRAAIAAQAVLARQRCGLLEGPLAIECFFEFEPPKGKSKLGYPHRDLDKCFRAVGDALVHGKLIADDKQIVTIYAKKRWREPGDKAGCRIVIHDAHGSAL